MGKHTVLIVDDDDYARQAWSQALRLQGYDVLEAGNIRDGLGLLRSSPCHVVLLDLCLPGILGQEGLSMIREDHPRLPVVIVTGTATVDDAVDCMKGGAVDLLTKPVRVARLLDAVAQAVEPSSVRPTSDGPPPSERLRTNLKRAQQRWALTDREGQVLEGILRGLSNKELAERVPSPRSIPPG